MRTKEIIQHEIIRLRARKLELQEESKVVDSLLSENIGMYKILVEQEQVCKQAEVKSSQV